jgi:hypothetical protein
MTLYKIQKLARDGVIYRSAENYRGHGSRRSPIRYRDFPFQRLIPLITEVG